MAANKEEDRHIAKTARAAAARINLDISELHITCGNGNIDMIGKVRAPRGATGSISVRKEFQSMIAVIRNVRGVRDVQSSRVVIFD
ncbi:hypothetical protein IAD21_04372 [Abditibacteriota bacterium]|nr:hypothetical protein IAD21_04372 [Abditibacteriota bacterium]